MIDSHCCPPGHMGLGPAVHLVPLAQATSGADGCKDSSPTPATQEVHLLTWSRSSQPGPPLVVPPEPARLAVVSTSADSAATRAPQDAPAEEPVIVETVHDRHHQLGLFILRPAATSLRRNGQPTPRLVLAREGDYLQFADVVGFRVAIYQRPNLGPPSPAHLGKECQVCRVPFQPGSRCYLCACGTATHCEDDREGGLECLQLRLGSGCPGCGRPLVLQAGYTQQEEDSHD